MDFQLSEEHQLFQRTVREFADKEIAPKALYYDKNHEFPWENIKKMAALGLLGVPYSEEWGGAGGDSLMYAIAVEEISRACGSTGIILAAHTSLGSAPFYLFGTEEQKRKYLIPLARGEKLGAFGLSEAEAGSDAAGTRTTAVLDGNEWVINGTKNWITSGSLADTVIITAMTDKSKGALGISNFIVEKGTPGFSYGKNEEKMGLRASVTSQLFFDNCRIPKENILGQPNDGFKQFMQILDAGRISIGAMALGIAQAAYEAAIRYATQRHQFGRPISDFQAIQFKLADMATQLEAARLLIYRSAWLKDKKLPFGKEAAMAKLFASEVGERACHQAIQIHGGYGYVEEYHVERYYRDIRLCEIGEGTSEIQRIVIARHLLRELKHQ
ncbi:MAG: acyl-CoA dehydrogenase [Chloroflexi bacterium]|uniref:Acyl-CoA dehydrogenase n=1 Tax=Candidatus Chlorohelix allophototropha TaxID=3003348 RepID=A0A8T7LRG9_9CHLR|nr:acyl-CoA dehydrogenase [Chloroflexota bacterium]WJW66477.1 acyl-CoA dehydrogenase [Chloroflexota bacterium L227-S17]